MSAHETPTPPSKKAVAAPEVTAHLRDGLLGALTWMLPTLALGVLAPGLAGTDGYFHIRFAEAGPLHWAARELPSMRWTLFSDGGWVDHQLLFHALQWPFTLVLPLLWAAKLSAVVFAGLAGGMMTILLAQRGVRHAYLWAGLAIATSNTLLFRMTMPRAQSVSLFLMLLGIALTWSGRRRWLVPLGFVFAWTYQVSALLVPVVAIAGLSRRDLRAPLLAGLGVVLGFTVHPQFPTTWHFFWQHAVLKTLNQTNQIVGNEWGAIPWSEWFYSLGVLSALTLITLMRRPRPAADTWSAIGLAAVWLLLSRTALKWLEYAVPFTALALALAWRDNNRSSKLIAAFLPLMVLNVAVVFETISHQVSQPERLAAVGAALPQEDCRVVHNNWADYAELFYHAPQCQFIVGLDPHFISQHDPERAGFLRGLSFGQLANVAQVMRQVFDSDWLVVTNPMAIHTARADPLLVEVVSDDGVSLFRVQQAR